MRFCRTGLPFALLALAAACGTGGNSSAQWNTMLDPTAHDSFFPIGAGSAHALGSDSPAITCNSCHGGASTFTQFDCLSCHQHSDQAALALGHRGVPQYAYASASCYSCHARGTAGGAVPSGAIGDPAQDLTVNAQIPSYVDTSISSLRPQAETLPMPMDHGTTPALFHASLTAANLPQPASCVDCHANSRPAVLLTSANAALPANVQFDHSVAEALGDCTSCHMNGGATQWTTWSGGQFHLAGDPTPATCLPCHDGERPTTTVNAPSGWI